MSSSWMRGSMEVSPPFNKEEIELLRNWGDWNKVPGWLGMYPEVKDALRQDLVLAIDNTYLEMRVMDHGMTLEANEEIHGEDFEVQLLTLVEIFGNEEVVEKVDWIQKHDFNGYFVEDTEYDDRFGYEVDGTEVYVDIYIKVVGERRYVSGLMEGDLTFHGPVLAAAKSQEVNIEDERR